MGRQIGSRARCPSNSKSASKSPANEKQQKTVPVTSVTSIEFAVATNSRQESNLRRTGTVRWFDSSDCHIMVSLIWMDAATRTFSFVSIIARRIILSRKMSLFFYDECEEVAMDVQLEQHCRTVPSSVTGYHSPYEK